MADDSLKNEEVKSFIAALSEIIEDLERELSIPAGFFVSLRKEQSDWAFIVKLHALFEAAITHLLVHYFGEEQLESIFTNLQMSDMKVGKIAFINKLKLLESEDISFIRVLSEIRNQYTHMIRNINMPLTDIINRLPKDRLQIIARKPAFVDDKESLKVKNNPRIYIFTTALSILPKIYFKKEDAKTKRDLLEKQRQIGEDFERLFLIADGNKSDTT